MPLKILPSAIEQTGDRQSLAIQASSRTTQVVANQLLTTVRYVVGPALVASEFSAATASNAGLYVADADCAIVRAYLLPRGDLTANNTNYATVSLVGAGVTGVGGGVAPTAQRLLARFATKGTDHWYAAGTPKAFTVLSGNITAGEIVRFTTTKTGAGVVVPACIIQLDLVPR